MEEGKEDRVEEEREGRVISRSRGGRKVEGRGGRPTYEVEYGAFEVVGHVHVRALLQ